MAVRDMQQRVAQRARLVAFALSAVCAILFWVAMPLGFLVGSFWSGIKLGFRCGDGWDG